MGKKRKWTKERREKARADAENSPIVRQLRELYERGMAELEARGEAERKPIDLQLRELYERGMAELQARRDSGQQQG